MEIKINNKEYLDSGDTKINGIVKFNDKEDHVLIFSLDISREREQIISKIEDYIIHNINEVSDIHSLETASLAVNFKERLLEFEVIYVMHD